MAPSKPASCRNSSARADPIKEHAGPGSVTTASVAPSTARGAPPPHSRSAPNVVRASRRATRNPTACAHERGRNRRRAAAGPRRSRTSRRAARRPASVKTTPASGRRPTRRASAANSCPGTASRRRACRSRRSIWASTVRLRPSRLAERSACCSSSVSGWGMSEARRASNRASGRAAGTPARGGAFMEESATWWRRNLPRLDETNQ